MSDYFNYGFTEETWKLYCDKQRRARGEVSQLNKIAVSTSQASHWLLWYSSSNSSSTLYILDRCSLGIVVLSVSKCVEFMCDYLNWKMHVTNNSMALFIHNKINDYPLGGKS